MRGERAVDVLATGSPQAVVAGARVDVLVTTERRTRLALENVEVLAARARRRPRTRKPPRVRATLRVTVAQAVYLVRRAVLRADVRLLARAPGDRREVGELVVEDGL